MMREYRLFFVKLPNGLLCREIFNITKPICELREKLCDHIGAGRFYVENTQIVECFTFKRYPCVMVCILCEAVNIIIPYLLVLMERWWCVVALKLSS